MAKSGVPHVLVFVLGLSSGAGCLHGASPTYGKIPVSFIANRGQLHASVRFTAQASDMTAYFTPEEVVVDLRGRIVRMRYPGSNPAQLVEGLDPQEGRAHYFIGSDPALWRTDVPLFGRIVYKEMYPGIDMIYSARALHLKSEFVVAAGADAARIRIAYAGGDSARVGGDGALIVSTPEGELREEAPEIYQESGAGRTAVSGAYVVSGDVVSFQVGDYDHSRALRIDPLLSYSTYLNGSGTSRATAIAVDSTGAAYVTGFTDSINFPMSGGPAQSASGGSVDAFVTKLNSSGTAIVYSTYLGGSAEDQALSIALDNSQNAYVTGWTSSPNFPVSSPIQSSLAGVRNAFVARLNSVGNFLVYSTYLGGSGIDSGNGIALDSSGAAYITGSTTSTNFPIVGAFQESSGGGQDGFVTRLNPAGNRIIYSTYLGGSLSDQGSSIAVDSNGAAYVAGYTSSANFPVTAALQATNAGAPDAFVTKLSPAGSSLVYSTYLGGSGMEYVETGRSIAVDSSGSAYVTGTTASANFPTFAPMQAANAGGDDAFVVKLTPAGTAFVYSTYLGGSSIDFGESIAVDSSGYAYIAGYTASPDFPTLNADQAANGGGYDAFISKLSPSGASLVEGDFLGGSGNDEAYGVALDSSGAAYLAGQTGSSNFPLKNFVQGVNAGPLAGFVAKFTFTQVNPPSAISVMPAGGSGGSQTFTLLYQDTRGAADISWVEVNLNATQSTTAACYLHYIVASNTIELATDAGTGWVSAATLGAVGTMQNSQCALNSSASSVSLSGNNLTLNLALTFLPAFAGAKNIYMQSQSATAGLAAWQARGTWTAIAALPANVSVTPSSGSGVNQTFSFTYSDPYGAADIGKAVMHFQTTLVAQNACYLAYTPANNTIALTNDQGTGNVGSAVLGGGGTIANSQCILNLATSSISSVGNNLTVNLSLIFMASFVGAKNISMGVVNNGNVFSGWQALGSWTIPSGGSLPPANVSVSPASGSGSNQTFSFIYTDPYGASDINQAVAHFQTSLVAQLACYLQYTPANNTIVLINDAGTGNAGSAILGTPGSMNNSQCTLNTGASSVSTAGNNLTLNLALVFKPVFAGTKNISMGVRNSLNVYSGWQALGSWTVTVSALLPPANVSVTPSSGSGSTQTFTFVYSDPYGFADISRPVVVIGPLVNNNTCYVQYFTATNTAQLENDAGSGFVGSGGTLGSSGALSNSQCTVNLSGSSASGAGNNLTLNLALTFTPALTGAQSVWMGVVNSANVFSGWQALGSWNEPLLTNISVTPSAGSGFTQTFTFVYSDSAGSADISRPVAVIGPKLSANGTCYVQYTVSTNTVQLENDAGNGSVGSGGTFGSSGSLANSQCTLSLSGSSASVSGNNLTMNVALTFASGFAGAQTTWMGVVNQENQFSGWQAMGSWTP
jgi:hypothetical protein